MRQYNAAADDNNDNDHHNDERADDDNNDNNDNVRARHRHARLGVRRNAAGLLQWRRRVQAILAARARRE